MLFMAARAFHDPAHDAMRVSLEHGRLADHATRTYARREMTAAAEPAADPAQRRQDAERLCAHCGTDRGDDALLLPQWSLDDWMALLAGAREQRLASGDVLMRAGQAQQSLYLLASGGLEVRAGTRGTLGAITRERPGAVIGEISFFDGGPRSATVWATEGSRLLELDVAAVQAFFAAHPARGQELLMALARVLARRVRRSEGRRVSDGL
jgi:CRP/FNR family transcriptional regulator, cyclic AMP receptor protein